MKRLLGKGPLFFCLFILGMQVLPLAQGRAGDERQVLKERAESFWTARVKGDWATVYDYLPEREKGSFTREQFVSFRREKGPFRYFSFTLGDIEIADQVGWVEMSSKTGLADYPGLTPKQTKSWQIWYKEEGKWCPLPGEQREEVPGLPPRFRSGEDEELLKRRADEFWNAKEAQDLELIYGFTDPDFKKRVSREDFLSKKALYSYFSHRIEWVEAIGLRGRVKVTYTYRLNDPSLSKLEPKEESVVEDWIKTGKLWYRKIIEGS